MAVTSSPPTRPGGSSPCSPSATWSAGAWRRPAAAAATPTRAPTSTPTSPLFDQRPRRVWPVHEHGRRRGSLYPQDDEPGSTAVTGAHTPTSRSPSRTAVVGITVDLARVRHTEETSSTPVRKCSPRHVLAAAQKLPDLARLPPDRPRHLVDAPPLPALGPARGAGPARGDARRGGRP